MAVPAVVIENYTVHGKSATVHDGFVYIYDTKLAQDKTRWKCINYGICKAYVWLHDGLIVKFGGVHTHEVEPERIEARKRVQQFKTDVVVQRHTHLDNLTASARDCEVVVQDSMPSTAAMKRMGRRHRVKVNEVIIETYASNLD